MFKTKTWIYIITVIFVISLGFTFYLYHRKPKSNTVEILQDGIVIKEINLSDTKKPYRFTVNSPNKGSNTIEVKSGKIRILEADCPDQICVKSGWLSESTGPIVCLPHKLVIQYAEETDIDSVAQ